MFKQGQHPGGQLYEDPNDENYRKLLGFILASSAASTPIDFSFFAGVINPIFSNRAIIENGEVRTCDDPTCHGVVIAGQRAPGGSDFPVFQNAADLETITLNFRSAAAFTNFSNPAASSLFLYPTNEIANADNPQATGLPHPPGAIFAQDSVSAVNILRWAGGLRADNGGAVLDWLVMGSFSTQDLQDNTPVDEATIAPRFGERFQGADARNGEWTVFTGVLGNALVNLDATLNEADADRTAYAVNYLVNLTNSPISARLNIASNVDMRVYIDGVLNTEIIAGANALGNGVAVVNIPPFSTTQQSSRVLLKMFQDQDGGQADLSFTAILTDENGVPLDINNNQVVVVKLGREGAQ